MDVKCSILMELKINFSFLRYLRSLLIMRILYQKDEPDGSPAFFIYKESKSIFNLLKYLIFMYFYLI